VSILARAMPNVFHGGNEQADRRAAKRTPGWGWPGTGRLHPLPHNRQPHPLALGVGLLDQAFFCARVRVVGPRPRHACACGWPHLYGTKTGRGCQLIPASCSTGPDRIRADVRGNPSDARRRARCKVVSTTRVRRPRPDHDLADRRNSVRDSASRLGWAVQHGWVGQPLRLGSTAAKPNLV